jgi:hypothetical protein
MELIERPTRSWTPAPSVREARRRGLFNQEEYDTLKATLPTAEFPQGRAVSLPISPDGRPNVSGGGDISRGSRAWGISSTVRIQLADKEGYLFKMKRQDAVSYAVWIEPEKLYCSVTNREVNCVEWVQDGGVRPRRGGQSPYESSGTLLTPKQLERRTTPARARRRRRLATA